MTAKKDFKVAFYKELTELMMKYGFEIHNGTDTLKMCIGEYYENNDPVIYICKPEDLMHPVKIVRNVKTAVEILHKHDNELIKRTHFQRLHDAKD